MNWWLWKNLRLVLIWTANLSLDSELHPRVNRPRNCKFCFNSHVDITDKLSYNYFKNITGVKVMYMTESSDLFFPMARLDCCSSGPLDLPANPQRSTFETMFPWTMIHFKWSSRVEKVVGQPQAKETSLRITHLPLNLGEPSYQSRFNWIGN